MSILKWLWVPAAAVVALACGGKDQPRPTAFVGGPSAERPNTLTTIHLNPDGTRTQTVEFLTEAQSAALARPPAPSDSAATRLDSVTITSSYGATVTLGDGACYSSRDYLYLSGSGWLDLTNICARYSIITGYCVEYWGGNVGNWTGVSDGGEVANYEDCQHCRGCGCSPYATFTANDTCIQNGNGWSLSAVYLD